MQPNHLNLDLERPHFEGINSHLLAESKSNNERSHPMKYVTYEELKRINREKYAIKHNTLVK